MNAAEEVFYRLAPGADVVRLNDGAVVLRSDVAGVRLEGASSALFYERVAPLLDGKHSLAVIAGELGDVDAGDLRVHLDTLVAQRVVIRQTTPPPAPTPAAPPPSANQPFLNLLQTLGVRPDDAAQRLRDQRVAVFGLEGHGAHAATALADCGLGGLTLVDPYPCLPEHLSLMPAVGRDAVGEPRENVLGASLTAHGTETEITTLGQSDVTREAVDALAADADLLVGCFDKAFSAVNHWINEASLRYGVPALYGQVKGTSGIVGPLVLPGLTACYLCWRMRLIACEEDFEAAMAHEEHLDGQRRPALHERAILPGLPAYVGGLLTVEAVKQLLELGAHTLAGRVHELDAATSRVQVYDVLAVPDCPACQKKNWPRRAHPPLNDLIGAPSPPGDILAVADRLVSGRAGVIRLVEPLPKDPVDPPLPVILRAEIANHRFSAHRHPDELSSSGKGMTLDDARARALGEAVERYSGGCWLADELLYATRPELSGPSLDPRDLVLYRPEQYAELSYHPYDEQTTGLNWVPSRSLVTGDAVLAPAQAVFMTYVPQVHGEMLAPVSSNGLAAGPTLVHAVLGGLLEVLERDAFLLTWMQRLPTVRVDPFTHPDPEIVGLCRSYARRGVDLHLNRLPTDHPAHVYLATATCDRGGTEPATVVGLGADVDGARAAAKSLLEIGQIRPTLRVRLREEKVKDRVAELVEDPRRVADLDDHDLLYCDGRTRPAFDFLRDGPVVGGDWATEAPSAAPEALSVLVDHFRSAGTDVLSCDLTPPEMEALGLFTARVIVPDFQPIHFGWKESRLGGRRLFELPYKLGFAAAPRTPADINPDPHPLA